MTSVGKERTGLPYNWYPPLPPPTHLDNNEQKKKRGGKEDKEVTSRLCFFVFGLLWARAELGHSCGMCFEALGMDVMEFRNKYSPDSVKNPRFHLKMVHLSQFPGLGVAML